MKKEKDTKQKKENFIKKTKGYLRYTFLRSNPVLKIYKKSSFKDKTPIQQNIFDRKTHGESLEFDHVVHYKFKYHFFLPALDIGRWILKKQIAQVQNIPDLPHNNNFTIFNQAFDESMIQWKRSYQMAGVRFDEKTKQLIAPSREETIKMIDKNNGSEKYLYTMKDIFLTMCWNDTAYREFFNMLIYNIGLKTIEKYRGQHVSHILYNSDEIYDVRYFAIQNALVKQQQENVAENPKGMMNPQDLNQDTKLEDIPKVQINSGLNKDITLRKQKESVKSSNTEKGDSK